MKKILVTYIYSQKSETANYLEYLIDKVREISIIDFRAICIDNEDLSEATINEIEKDLRSLIKKENFGLANEIRERLNRKLLAKKYENTLPVLNAELDSEHEISVTGSKKSLAKFLDYITMVSFATEAVYSMNFKGLDQIINKVISEVSKNKIADEGLETTQGVPDVT